MNRNKHVVSATVSPLTERQLDALVGSHQLFSSRSDAVEKAIGMMFCALNAGSLCNSADQYGLSLHASSAGQSAAVMG